VTNSEGATPRGTLSLNWTIYMHSGYVAITEMCEIGGEKVLAVKCKVYTTSSE